MVRVWASAPGERSSQEWLPLLAQKPMHNALSVTMCLNNIEAERAAMLLAMTRTLYEENALKEQLSLIPGIRFAVCEAGGLCDQVQRRINAKLLGVSVNHKVIDDRQAGQVHSFFHAVLEAKRGMMLDVPTTASLAMKVAVVVKDEWIAVAIFGQSAMHITTNHFRAGLGVMHFPI